MFFDRPKYKQFAKEQLSGRSLFPILITLITLLISLALSTLQFEKIDTAELTQYLASGDIESASAYISSMLKGLVGNLLVALLTSAIGCIINYASITYYSEMTKSPEKVGFSVFVQGFNDWVRALGTGFYIALRLFLWGLILIAGAFVGLTLAIILVASFSIAGMPESVTLGVSITVFVIIYLGSAVPYFIKLYAYSFTTYIAVENPHISIPNALTLSNKLTRGFKWSIFKLEFSFLPLIFISLFLAGIPLLYIVPYMNLSKLNAYHAILRNAVDQKLLPEEVKE